MAESGNGERRRDHREGRNGERDSSGRREVRRDHREGRNGERDSSGRRERREDRVRERPEGTIIRDHRERESGSADADIDWQPTVMAPVFYGVADFYEEVGLPGPMHVFYPSLSSAVAGAELLKAPNRFPLILFLHGNCNEDWHYKRWYRLPAALARCGYVVVVPDLPNIRTDNRPWDEDNDEELVNRTLAWIRNRSEFGDTLTQREVGVIGHSFGALLGGVIVRRALEARILRRVPYMSLSGVWINWREFPLNELRTPSLFAWGTAWDTASENFAQLIRPDGIDSGWSEVPTPKHRLELHDAHHWDYLPPGSESCGFGERGPCDLVMPLAADFACTFFNRYLPPPETDDVAERIGNNLVPPPLDLTEEQESFARNHLVGLSNVGDHDGCSLTHSWELSRGGSDSVSLP